MVDWSGKRKEWTTARDKHDVAKGAVSSVSIGDSIDKVNKSIGKGYKPLLAALTTLETNLAKYRAGLAKAKPKKNFPGWIDANISKEIDDLKSDIAKDLASLKLVTDTIASSQYTPLSAVPETTRIPNYQKYMKENPTATWAQATQAIKLFDLPLKLIPGILKRAKELEKIEWQAKLKGFDASYKTVETFGEDMTADVVFLAKWVKTPDFEGFLKALQKGRQRSWSHEDSAGLKQAAAKLIG